MQQLGQLQKLSDEIDNANARVLVVFREEQDGQEGLQEVREHVTADFALTLDLHAEQTKAYGMGPPTFETFLIDPEGVIRVILSGSTYNRPLGTEIVRKLQAVSSSGSR